MNRDLVSQQKYSSEFNTKIEFLSAEGCHVQAVDIKTIYWMTILNADVGSVETIIICHCYSFFLYGATLTLLTL